MIYSTEDITYCVPSQSCSNTTCLRHRVHAPTGVVGISVSDLWATCGVKRADIPQIPYRPVA